LSQCEIPGIQISESQSLLLAMLAAPASDVRSLYEKWAAATPFDLLDGGSYRLMPMLHKKIAPLNLHDARYEKIKGIYRYTLYKNSMILSGLRKIIQSLSDAGVRVMILKGASLILTYYPDKAVRPMNDIDLLVEEKNLNQTLDVLTGLGFQDIGQQTYDLSLRRHPAVTLAGRHGFELDVHWNLLTEYNPQNDPVAWWRDARVMDWQGLPVCLLSPEDQVMHLCAHGVKWDALPSIRWIPDVLNVLCHEPDIAWPVLLDKCSQRRLTLPVRCGLLYLKKHFDAPVPEDVLELLFRQSVSLSEEKLFTRYTSPPGFSTRVIRQWGLCHKDYPDASWLNRACRFPGYLKQKSGMVTYTDCAGYLLAELGRCVSKPITNRKTRAVRQVKSFDEAKR
jgi:hypothetical protein